MRKGVLLRICYANNILDDPYLTHYFSVNKKAQQLLICKTT